MYSIQIAIQGKTQPIKEVVFTELRKAETGEEAVRLYFDMAGYNKKGWTKKAAEEMLDFEKSNNEDIEKFYRAFTHSEERPCTLILTGQPKKGGYRLRIIKEN